MRLIDETEKLKNRLTALRREFHANPDMTGHEEKTIDRIAAHLSEAGIPFEIVEGGGLLAYIYGKGFEPEEGKEPWRKGYVEDGDPCLFASFDGTGAPRTGRTWKMNTVLLRADVDALPVEESPVNLAGPRVCISENPGICHACGHDGHIAMLLVAGEYLYSHRELVKGRIILMFERGEEGPNNVIRIYRHMISKNIHTDTAYGCHLYFALETGKVSVRTGPVMAGGVFYKVKLIGKGGHGSRPDLSCNPIDCYVSLMNGLNEFRMKHVDPFHSLTYAPTVVHSGAVDNVIPGDLVFAGNVRLYDLEDGVRWKSYFYELLDRICPLYGVTYEIEYCIGPKVPVKNDPACADLARRAFAGAIGEENVIAADPWMACESFCTTLAVLPGVFALVGTKNEKAGSGAPHHNALFDLDEESLPAGCACAVSYALEYLENPPAPGRGWFAGGLAELYDVSGYGDEKVAYLKDGTPFDIVDGKR